MSISLIRIDDRLVHGQVVEGWIKHLNITKVTVVSNAIVDNWARRTVMELSLPHGVKFQVITVEEMGKRGNLTKGRESDGERELVLFSSPSDVLIAIKGGLQITKINLGGMHHFDGYKRLTTNITITKKDETDLRCLLETGVSIKVCALPKEIGIDLINLL